MRHMKKIASLVLALVMALALAVPALATNSNSGTGSITITNAAMGEEYKVVKLFDMEFDTANKAYRYTGTVPTELNEYFVEDTTTGAITATEKAKDGDDLSEEAVTAIKAWAATQSAAASGTASGGELTFTGLGYGYYVVISRASNGGAISVTSTNPHPEIVDKNQNKLTGAEKKVTDGAGDVIQTAAVGATVTYVASVTTVNWIGEGEGAERVINYVINDTLPGFLTSVNVTKITAGDTELGVQQFDENKEILIPWAEKGELDCEQEHEHTDACYKWTSKYANGVKLEITYTAVVTGDILDEGESNHKNTVTFTAKSVNKTATTTTDEDLYTAKIVIDKYEEGTETKKLADAEFVLRDGDGTDAKYYKWTPEVKDDEGNVTTHAKGEWVTSEAEATKFITGANGAAEIEGLKAGTYYLEETKAPVGYNKLTTAKEITINEGGDITANLSATAEVGNNTGALLPSTGGIGTTIFYVVGGLLAAGAVILLITKRRMNIEK